MGFSKEVCVGPVSLILQENTLEEEEVKIYTESQRDNRLKEIVLFFFFSDGGEMPKVLN